MAQRQNMLSAIAAVLLAASLPFSFRWPIVGLALSASTLTIALYLRHRGAFREGNTPLLGALLIGGGAITVLGGVFAVLFTVSQYAAFMLFGALLTPPFVLLLVFGIRERIRSIERTLDEAHREDHPDTRR
jgi:hypothetical protein